MVKKDIENIENKKKKPTREEKKQLKQYKKENNIPSIWDYFKDYKAYIFWYIFFTIVVMLIGVAVTLLFAEVISLIIDGFYTKAVILSAIILGLYIIERLSYILLNVIYMKFSTKVVARLNNDLSYQAFKFSASTYANNSTGTFVQRIVTDPNRLVGQLASFVDMVGNLLYQLIICIYIFVINYIVGLILLGGVVVCFVFDRFRLKLRRKNIKIANKKYDKVNSLTTEIIKSERDIKSLGLEDKLRYTTENYYNEYNKFQYKSSIQQTSITQFRNIANRVFGMAMLIVAIIMLEKGLLVYASFMIIYSNRGSFGSLSMLTGMLGDIVSDVKVYSDRIFEMFDPKKFPVEKFGSFALENVKGKIEFKNVSYAYIDKLLAKDELDSAEENSEIVKRDKVLENLSFVIEPNTTVAFVGKSGSGKSTILSLMSKMYEVDEGEVLIDDVNINDLNKESLRKNISLVNQFPYIFDMSILDNLLMAKKDATEEEINDAIEKADLKGFIDGLKEGINTVVGESGIKLSGGQRQRLAIARALLRKSSIIIFDESTSSLDNIAQEHIKNSIDNLKGSSTIVIVAHRLSTIKNVDKIFFLDEGKIIDSGTFDELFENNERFNHMFLAENI